MPPIGSPAVEAEALVQTPYEVTTVPSVADAERRVIAHQRVELGSHIPSTLPAAIVDPLNS
jgi:hypothetical protein